MGCFIDQKNNVILMLLLMSLLQISCAERTHQPVSHRCDVGKYYKVEEQKCLSCRTSCGNDSYLVSCCDGQSIRDTNSCVACDTQPECLTEDLSSSCVDRQRPCSQCDASAGYYADANGVCQNCTALVQNCSSPDASLCVQGSSSKWRQACTQCNSGYFPNVSQDQCTPCSNSSKSWAADCSEWAGAGLSDATCICSHCQSQYWLDNGSCTACVISASKCSQGTHPSCNGGSDYSCISCCGDGSFYTSGTCPLDGSSVAPTCSVCNTSECPNGSYLAGACNGSTSEDASCIACKDASDLLNCSDISPPNSCNCSTCNTDYYRFTYKQAGSDLVGCKTCVDAHANCSTCNDSLVDGSYTIECLTCEPNYVIVNGSCELCKNKIPGCLECHGSDASVTCNTCDSFSNYHLNSSDTCSQCGGDVIGPEYFNGTACQPCSDNAANLNCSMCKNNPSSTGAIQCVQCDFKAGYGRTDDLGKSSLPYHCQQCAQSLPGSSEQSGRTVLQNKSDQELNISQVYFCENCSSVYPGASTCYQGIYPAWSSRVDTCQPGYHLLQEKCIPSDNNYCNQYVADVQVDDSSNECTKNGCMSCFITNPKMAYWNSLFSRADCGTSPAGQRFCDNKKTPSIPTVNLNHCAGTRDASGNIIKVSCSVHYNSHFYYGSKKGTGGQAYEFPCSLTPPTLAASWCGCDKGNYGTCDKQTICPDGMESANLENGCQLKESAADTPLSLEFIDPSCSP